MSRINVLLLSDIHFKNTNPADEGQVFTAFFKDIKETVGSNQSDYNYCIISGDLVNAGASDQTYANFYSEFIKKLLPYVPQSHFMITPGNHDLNRNVVQFEFDLHQQEISSDYNEIQFNADVKDDKKRMVRKFRYFDKFCRDTMLIENYALHGYYRNVTPKLSFFFLNTSFCSCGGYNDIEDQGHLRIETDAINKWVQENEGRKKILVMHHPLEHLIDDNQHMLMSLLRSEIDIVLSGHTHYQIAENVDNGPSERYLKFTSPQLFSTEGDLNGYSILVFDESNLESIHYRQYSERNNCFFPGQEFSGTPDGIKRFETVTVAVEDVFQKRLKGSLEREMVSFGHTPAWAERTLTNIAIGSASKENEEIYDYVRIINHPKNYQIVAPEQFGTTCFARYLSLKAWEEKHQLWLYLDISRIKKFGIEKAVSVEAGEYLKKTDDVQCVILDNWYSKSTDQQQNLAHLRKKFPHIIIFLITTANDSSALKGLDTDESFEGFVTLYLKELNTAAVRTIVHGINEELYIGEENLVMKRLNEDLMDLNMYKVPYNCIQLLLSLKNNLKKRPVNRVRVMDELLKILFTTEGVLYYRSVVDDRACKYLIGYLCELLLRAKHKDSTYDMSFDETFFKTHLTFFAKKEFDDSNIVALLETLLNNQILIRDEQGKLHFRFSHWIYFFAAERMKIDEGFWKFMVNDFKVIYYPVIIEYYTGTDGARKDIIPLLVETLHETVQLVHEKVGIADDFNPYNGIKWNLQENTKIQTLEEVTENVRKSNLPDELKDAALDKGQNQIRPYNQEITLVMDRFFVKNLFNLVRSASRALRNSEYIGGDMKEELFDAIKCGWREIEHVLLLLSPALAKNGYGGMGGERFQLDDSFPKEFDTCWIRILTMLPFNIVEWLRIDTVSDRLLPIFEKTLESEKDEVMRHIAALMVCAGQMDGCDTVITKYIYSVHKNSYYLYDIYFSLLYYYRYRYLDSPERHSLEKLIKASYAKHFLGVKEPGKDAMAKAEKAIGNIEKRK